MAEFTEYAEQRMRMLRDEARNSRAADEGKRPRWHLKPWRPRYQFTLTRAVDDTDYLTRWWLLATPWGGIALHRMDGPDARADTLHDHPMAFVSRVLRGGYIEQRLDPSTMFVGERVVTRWNVMRRYDAHTITGLLRVPTWTLLFMSPNRRKWGFLEPASDYRAWNYVPDGEGGTMPDGRWTAPGGRWVFTHHDAFDAGHYLPDNGAYHE